MDHIFQDAKVQSPNKIEKKIFLQDCTFNIRFYNSILVKSFEFLVLIFFLKSTVFPRLIHLFYMLPLST